MWLWTLPLLVVLTGCSGLSNLTPESLQAAEQRWNAAGLSNYRMVLEMKGDRVEPSVYEVTVRGKEVAQLKRNGQVVLSGGGSQDYSVEGLFHILDLEIDLEGKPQILGAPPGYASYPMAGFDPTNGRLLRFQRSVGGTKNNVEIRVREFDAIAP